MWQESNIVVSVSGGTWEGPSYEAILDTMMREGAPAKAKKLIRRLIKVSRTV